MNECKNLTFSACCIFLCNFRRNSRFEKTEDGEREGRIPNNFFTRDQHIAEVTAHEHSNSQGESSK